jgi:phosphatidylglycerol:prolipoprotein diacylglycerol transferase
MIVLGIIAALYLMYREVSHRKGSLDFFIDALPWLFIGGIVGARIWHIISPSQSMVARGITTRYYLTHLNEAIAIWKGGVGIIGAVLGGVVALLIFAGVKKVPAAEWLDITAPGLALGQAIGRWGNYINQEVYGLPSNLPWAIHIDPQHRLPGYEQISTYHPWFLYESIWNILNMVFLLLLARKFPGELKPGTLFLSYVVFYGMGRVGLEFLRLDPSTFRGVNINQVFMAAAVLSASIVIYLRQKGYLGESNQE